MQYYFTVKKASEYLTVRAEQSGRGWEVKTSSAAIASDGGACWGWTVRSVRRYRNRRQAKAAWQRLLSQVNPTELVDCGRIKNGCYLRGGLR